MLVRAYLQLFRAPGTLTAASNILFGFFVTQSAGTDWAALPFLIASSVSLYLAGMILNDYFDYEIDKKERPFRPLPSGKIQKNRALALGMFFIISANVWSAIVGQQSLFLSLMLGGLIFFYNAQAKKIIPLGIIVLCLIRFVNVILGTSSEPISAQSLLFPIPLATLIAGISILSSVETKFATKNVILLNSVTLAVAVLTPLVLFYKILNGGFFVFLAVFLVSTGLPLAILKGKTSISVQKIITFQLLSVIILDATMTALFADLSYGLIIISLYLPGLFLGKKIYVT